MKDVHVRASARNSSPSQIQRDLRAELELLQARYDSGAVSQAVFSVINREVDFAWIERRGRS
jgi:hypothetical protein